jgi:hypothetical protein
VHLDIVKFFIYSPIDAQVNCLKNNFKIYIKSEIKTAPKYFGAVTPSSGSALLVLAKVTVVKIVCLFSWRHNPSWLYFPQTRSGL